LETKVQLGLTVACVCCRIRTTQKEFRMIYENDIIFVKIMAGVNTETATHALRMAWLYLGSNAGSHELTAMALDLLS
jgi:hypothetical protein